MAEQPRDEEAIFLAALEKTTPQERNAFVEGACVGDPELLERVRELLESHDESVGPLDSPPPGLDATIDQPITEGPGSRIDRYKLLEQIGEGGFGVVFMAEQQEPVRRKVALKVIKPGMDTKEVIARFEAERQALAMMDHPNIARVLDADTTESGRPYFVMELVRGVPITNYCDQNNLTPRERLELFGSVCRAVQHAHQKGIIHRDIKPSNVMVTLRDDTPVAKVIDFGVAKATNQRLTEKTLFTRYSQMIGTPLYMSPEQAQMNEWDVDTRSDIYSLGVLLYELLSGTTPFDKERMRRAAYDELLKIIREEEPPKPSMRISTLGDMATDVSAHRKSDPKKLSAVIRGELDWIVMKALEKDRTRRYETANGLANDIARYLNDEAITARPPSALYRFRKLARRNKAALATTAVVAAALLVGIVGTTWQAIRATDARDDAVQAQTEEAKQRVLAEKAKTAAEEARAVAENARRQEQTQREEAERQRERAEANFGLARSAVDEFLNQVTKNELLTVPGLQPLRQELLSSAMEFYDNFTQDAENASELLVELAAAHHRISVIRGELGQKEESEASNAKSIELFEQLRDGGNDGLEVRLGLAKACFRAKRYDDVVALCQTILETDAKHAETRSLLANTYNSLAVGEEDIATALKYHQQARPLRERLVEDFPDKPEYLAELGSTLNNLGVLLGRQGERRKALDMFQRGVSYKAEAYSNAPQTILWGRWLGIGLRNAAGMQALLGNQQEALRSYQWLVDVRRQLAFQNPAVPSLKGDLYKAYLDLGNYQKELGDAAAENRSLRAAQEVLENIPQNTPDELFELATVYGALATPDEGATAPTKAERDDQQLYANRAMENIVKAVEAGYRNLEALQSHKHLTALREKDDFQKLLSKLEKEKRIEDLATKEGDTDKATLPYREQAIEALRELISSDSAEVRHQTTLAAMLHSIGEIQIGLKQYDEAEKSLQEALEIRKRILDEKPDDPQAAIDVLAVQVAIGQLHWARQDYPKAHQCWQACLAQSLQVAQANRDDQDLQQSVSIQERRIFQHYGRCGLFSLVREHAARSKEFDRVRSTADVPELASEGEFAAVFLLDIDRELARGYFRRLAESLRNAGYQWRIDLIHLVRCIAAFGDNDLLSEELLSQYQSVFDKSPGKEWIAVGMGMVHCSRSQYTEAQSVLEGFRESHTPQLAFLDAAIASKLGDTERAQQRWSEAEARYHENCRDALARDVADDNTRMFNQNWWQFAYDQAMRRLALEAISGQPPTDDPWQHLIQARSYRLIGEIEKAEAELAAASAAAPDDADVWLARARLLGKWDEIERAEGDWQKVVDLAGDDPMPWIHRGRWYAERGEHEKADADFAKAASLTPDELNKFLEAGWWVVGPYPPNLDEFCPPEIAPDPSKPVHTIDPKTGLSDEPVAWRSTPIDKSGLVDINHFPDWKDSTSQYYALTHVYSPDERCMLMRGEVPQQSKIRLWVNGVEIGAISGQGWHKRIPIILRPGRNELLLKGSAGACRLRMGDSPVDRALTLMEQGRWFEATTILRELNHRMTLSNSVNRELLSSRLLPIVACSGDRRTYNAFAEAIFPHPLPSLLGLSMHSILPHPSFDKHADEAISRGAKAVAQMPHHHGLKLEAAMLNYRAGRFSSAQTYLDEIPEGNYAFQCSLPLRALLCWKQEEESSAHRWLSLALEPFDAITGADGQMLPVRQQYAFNWALEMARFCAQLREAQREITGSDADIQAKFRAFAERQRDYWSNVDAATALFDHAVFAENIRTDVPRVLLARGRRLAEVERWDDAEADFNEAVELAPDDPQVLAARAVFYADRGEADKAASDFRGALSLANVAARGDYWKGLPVYLEVAQRDDVLERLEALRPDDGHPRLIHMILQVQQGQLDVAMRDAERLASYGPFRFQMDRAAVALLRGDKDRLAAIQADRESLGPMHKVMLLGLAPTQEPTTTELLTIANENFSPPDGPSHWLWLGQAQFRAGKLDEAVATLEAYANRPLSWPLLSMAHHQLGNTELARRYLHMTAIQLAFYKQTSPARFADAMYRGVDPPNWLRMVVHYREAKQLIDGPEALAAEEERLAAQQAKLRLKRAQRAEADFQRLVDQAGDDPVPWIRRACWYARRGDFEKAMADFDKAQTLAPDDPRVWRTRGEVYEKLDQWDKAIADYQKVIELEPEKWKRWKVRAEQFAQSEQWNEAIALYSSLVEHNPDNWELWQARAAAYIQLKQQEKAIEDYGRVIKLRPDDARVWSQRGRECFRLDQWDQAIEDCSQAIKLRPDDTVSYAVRSAAYRNKGDFAKAIDDCTSALRIDSKSTLALINRAMAYRRAGRYDEAIEDANMGLKIAPHKVGLLHERARNYAHLGEHDKAIADCNRAVELEPDDATTARIRAQMLLLVDRTEEYRLACEDMLDRFARSEDPEVLCQAARACVLVPKAIPDPTVAVRLAERAVSSDLNEGALYTLGMAQLRAGQLDEAAERFHESLNRDPSWRERHLNWLGLALVHHGRGETEEARQWLAEAVESFVHRPALKMQDEIEGELLRREAEQLLGKPEQDDTESKQKAPDAKPKPEDANAAESKPPAPEATSSAKPKEKQE